MPPSPRCRLGLEAFADRLLPSGSYFSPEHSPGTQGAFRPPDGESALTGRVTDGYAVPPAPGTVSATPGTTERVVGRSEAPGGPLNRAGLVVATDVPFERGYSFDVVPLFAAFPVGHPGISPPHDAAFPWDARAEVVAADAGLLVAVARQFVGSRLSAPGPNGQSVFLPVDVVAPAEPRRAAGHESSPGAPALAAPGSTSGVASLVGDTAVTAGLMFGSGGDRPAPAGGPPGSAGADDPPAPDLFPAAPPVVVSTLTTAAGWVVPAVPGGAVAIGLFGLDVARLGGQVGRLLDRVAGITPDPDDGDGPGVDRWLAAAAVLTAGAGYAAWSARPRRPGGPAGGVGRSAFAGGAFDDDHAR